MRPNVSTLLSQVLIAYTIEADNEFESLMPHRTALSRAAGQKPRGPWLISLAMWVNFLRYVTEDGITVADLSRRSGIRKVDTGGMQRWGYVSLDHGILRPTAGGARAATIWAPIEDRVESRWRERFGADAVDAVRASVASSVADIVQVGPDYLPIVRYGLETTSQLRADRDARELGSTFSALLCRALTVVAVAFERSSPISLALAANVLRVVEATGTPVRDLAARAGVAKEITDVSLGYLETQGLATVSRAGGSKVVGLTDAGRAAQEFAAARLDELDARFVAAREPLARILSDTPAMADALQPHPESWRASSKYAAQTKRMLANPRAALAHFPIVTHRGGYPDGS